MSAAELQLEDDVPETVKQDRRDRVIEYVRQKYGADHVCQMVRNVYSGRVAFCDGDELCFSIALSEFQFSQKGFGQ